MEKFITTVGELREQLRCCEEDEPISFIFEEEQVMAPKVTKYMKCMGASSTAGGRAINLWFERAF